MYITATGHTKRASVGYREPAARLSQIGVKTLKPEAGFDSPSSILLKAVGESKEAVTALTAQVAAMRLEITAVSVNVSSTTDAVQEMQAIATPTGPAGSRTYASAASATPTMTAEHAGILARGTRMRRQILVDKASDAGTDSLGGLSEVELREKANLALGMMTEKKEGARFVGARRLPNGGVVFDCLDEATAVWVKAPAVMKQFIDGLGASCVYRPRRLEMVAEMVPVDMRIEDMGSWKVVESDSGLKDGDIVGARWIKAPHRRTPGQKVAHLKIEFSNPGAANHVIDGDLFIQGMRVRVRKSEEEARRCARCQKYDGHFAHACKASVEVCGRCAAPHRTADCMVANSNRATFKCSNCEVSGHGAVERECPAFIKEQQKRRAKDPTAGYRYFPTEDPRTWVSDATPVQPQPQQQQTTRGGGSGRLAGGFAGQGGGGSGFGAPVDQGWAGRPRRGSQRDGDNMWSLDGMRQPAINDVFSRTNAGHSTGSLNRAGGDGVASGSGGRSGGAARRADVETTVAPVVAGATQQQQTLPPPAFGDWSRTPNRGRALSLPPPPSPSRTPPVGILSDPAAPVDGAK